MKNIFKAKEVGYNLLFCVKNLKDMLKKAAESWVLIFLFLQKINK